MIKSALCDGYMQHSMYEGNHHINDRILGKTKFLHKVPVNTRHCDILGSVHHTTSAKTAQTVYRTVMVPDS